MKMLNFTHYHGFKELVAKLRSQYQKRSYTWAIESKPKQLIVGALHRNMSLQHVLYLKSMDDP